MTPRLPFISTPLALLLAASAFVGCAGYRMGTASLYPPDIQTVYVPLIESDSYRRFLGERLTEALMKEIELKTPYKVVSTPQADSILTCRILNDTKRVLIEDRNDQPRETEINLVVRINWINRKGDLIGQESCVPIPLDLSQSGKLIPEYGQSVVTAQQDAIDRLAQQIVAFMEVPW